MIRSEMNAIITRVAHLRTVGAIPSSKTSRKSTVRAVPEIAQLAGLQDSFAPIAASLNEQNLPPALVKWGHPGNMTVVLSAMGGYGSYLGWKIRLGDEDPEVMEKARKSHPGLMVGMGTFFALGAIGGMLSLTMQGKPILTSPHVWSGFGGLALLGLNGMLALFFEDDPNARSLHAYLGSATMAVFVLHLVFGLQLGLSI